MAKDDVQYGGWNSYTLQCGMWLWDHDSEFTKWQYAYPATWHVALGWNVIEFARWQHIAMWQVALGWHAVEFTQKSAILEFYFKFRFRPYHRSRHAILHQSAKFYPNRTTLGRKKWRHVDFPKWRISSILDFRGPIMGPLKSPCVTSYRSSIETMALNCLVFEKIAFLYFRDRQTDEPMYSTDVLSRSRCRERRLLTYLLYQ